MFQKWKGLHPPLRTRRWLYRHVLQEKRFEAINLYEKINTVNSNSLKYNFWGWKYHFIIAIFKFYLMIIIIA